MLEFNHLQKYYLYPGSTDMQKGYDGLSGLVGNEMEENPLNGSVYAKRLDRGRFEQITKGVSSKKFPVLYQHLVMLLSGILLIGMKQRHRLPDE